MKNLRRLLPWALVLLAGFYTMGAWTGAFAADPATTPTPVIVGADMGDINIDPAKLIEDLRKGNAPGVIGVLIALLTLLISGKAPKIVTDWLNDPKNEWAKPALTILLGVLGVAMPQLLAGVGLGKALLFGFMSSGGAALAFKMVKTVFNSWAAKKGIHILDVPAPQAAAIMQIADITERTKAWTDFVTKLSGGTTVPAATAASVVTVVVPAENPVAPLDKSLADPATPSAQAPTNQ